MPSNQNILRNVPREVVVYDRFNGGLAASIKGGGGFHNGYGLNIHEDPTYFKANPRTVKDSGTLVRDTVIDAVRVRNGDTFFLDKSANLYKRTAAGAYSIIGHAHHIPRIADLIGYWPLDNTTAGQTQEDFSDTGTDLTDVNTVGVSTTAANVVGAASADFEKASSHALEANDNATLSVTGQLSMSAMILPESIDDAHAIMAKNLTTGDQRSYSLVLESDGTLQFSVSSDGTAANTKTLATSTVLVAGTKYHVGVRYVPSVRMDIFINGALDISTTTTVPSAIFDGTGKFTIGAQYSGASSTRADFFDGLIDEAMIWDTALADEDFDDNYDALLNEEGCGLFYWVAKDQIYVTTPNHISKYGPITNGTPVFKHGFYGEVEDVEQTGTGQVYTTPTSITETNANLWPFVPGDDFQKSVWLYIKAPGTGNVTVTVHDDSNNVIASKTIAGAKLVDEQYNEFIFDTPWRPVIGATYHIHVTSSVADTQIDTGTASTLSDGTTSNSNNAHIKTWVHRLVTPRSGFHPMFDFTTFLMVANERYVETYSGLVDAARASTDKKTSSFNFRRLTLPAGYEVSCYARLGEYIAIGCEYRGDNDADFASGLIFFWDGVSSTFNFYTDVVEGGVQTMLSIKNRLYFLAGLRGEMFVTGGGEYVKLKRFPKTTDIKYVRTTYASATIYQGLPCFALAYTTDNALFQHGVYTYGAKEAQFSDVLNYDWYPSTGNRESTAVKIGMVRAFGTDLFMGCKYSDGTYGIDIVEPSNAPYAEIGIDLVADDRGNAWHKKFQRVIRVDHQPLVSGNTVQIYYKIDQESSWQAGSVNSTVGSTETVLKVEKQFKDIQARVICGNTTVSVQVNDVVLDIEPRPTSEIP